MRLAAVLLLLAPLPALAVPGPDSVVILANASVPESVSLAQRYAAARSVPSTQLCALPLPDRADITLAEYRTLLLEPFTQCVLDGGFAPRMEAVMVMRGVPLRVILPLPDGDERVSLAAALGAWQSARLDGTPVLDLAPGTRVDCGGVLCLLASWRNPYTRGAFAPGFSSVSQGVSWTLLLVTMLHGRSYEDAERLLTSALDGEQAGGARGEFLFMNGADGARAALDPSYDTIVDGLRMRGFTDVSRVPFSMDLTGHTLASFMVGTASLGQAIEGNTFLPGSIVDNLTSFGALAENFEPSGEVQVSIARWVAKGVAGVHGTTDEPLSNAFPSRQLVLDYVDGATLGEAFHRNMPFVFWRNLVLGDVMAAPYAQRPSVQIHVMSACDGSHRVSARAMVPPGRMLERLALYADGVEIDEDATVADGTQVLAVALLAPSDDGKAAAKGWASITVQPHTCATDAGSADAATTDDAPQGSCACTTSSPSTLLISLAALALRRRSTRR